MHRLISAAALACTFALAATAAASAAQPGLRCVQNQLNALGFNAGPADGSIGPRTRNAAEEYRAWMSGGAGGAGWSLAPLTALNGTQWCDSLADAHPSVAKYVEIEPRTSVSTAAGKVTAVVDFPGEGRVTGMRLLFAFRTECERDHAADFTAPDGRRMGMMDRGLGRCSGKPVTFTSDNRDDSGMFDGASAKGRWTFTFKDLDANFHSGQLSRLRLELTVDNGGASTRHVVDFDGLPVQVPNPV